MAHQTQSRTQAGLMPSRAGPETLLSVLCTHGAESPHGNLRERHGALRPCRLWLGDLELAIDSGQRATHSQAVLGEQTGIRTEPGRS
jgi:hypothetical protein